MIDCQQGAVFDDNLFVLFTGMIVSKRTGHVAEPHTKGTSEVEKPIYYHFVTLTRINRPH